MSDQHGHQELGPVYMNENGEIVPADHPTAPERSRDFNNVMSDVKHECHRQVQLRKEGRFRFAMSDAGLHPTERLAMIAEEVGEVARHSLGGLVLDSNSTELRKELIQVAALSAAWVWFLDNIGDDRPF